MLYRLLSYPSWMAFTILALQAISSYAQTETPPVKPAYYLDVNKAVPTTVHDIQEGVLPLQYEDRFGQRKETSFTLYNWKRKPVTVYQLAKTYGNNYFRIDLGEAFANWPTGEVYTGELSDESGKRYSLSLRKIAPPDKAAPQVQLKVNPLHFSCQNLTGNTVEFYADISGGKAPYQVNWYVLNDERTDLLYQPRQQLINKPGNTVVIQVDKNPNYYVLVHITDACGNKQNQMVYLTCHQRKQINTVFVEPIQLQDLPQLNHFKR